VDSGDPGAKGLYHYLQSVQGYLAPPIFVVFFLGVFMKRLNSQGCLAALDCRVSCWVCSDWRWTRRSRWEWPGLKNGYAEGSFLWIVNNTYFQYFSLFIFIVCVVVMIGVSYLTEPPPGAQQLRGMTLSTVEAADRAHSRASWDQRDVIASCVVVLLILMAYLYFRG
jgi:solute:Na+ symporter, SSS family